MAVLIVSGCALVPPEPVVTGPLTAPPPMPVAVPSVEANGAIYQPTAYGSYPLFEDRRPRNVGDIVTVVIQERTNAAKNVQTTTDRNSSGMFGAEIVPDLLPSSLGGQGFEMSGENSLDGRGSTRADNTFTGTLTTTVVGVLPNGNLQIAGDKQMAINRGSEHIRFSGVVDPRSITGNGTVLSTQVADARIEFRSKGTMDEVQTMGWLQRFFLNVSPF
ncbi:MAG: flagellar basal body L-ring protein FlgH [Burkholderiaceae bacterium]